jgi:hypothetical protein
MLGRAPVSADDAAASPFDHPPNEGDHGCSAESRMALGEVHLF